jgi:hypothetical protein
MFPTVAKFRVAKTRELVHRDLCGPVMPATPRGKHYFFHLVDDVSRYMWLMLLATKDVALVAYCIPSVSRSRGGKEVGNPTH